MIDPRFVHEGCVFWVDPASGALRHGPLIREDGDLLLVRLSRELVIEIHREQLKAVPRFFNPDAAAGAAQGSNEAQRED